MSQLTTNHSNHKEYDQKKVLWGGDVEVYSNHNSLPPVPQEPGGKTSCLIRTSDAEANHLEHETGSRYRVAWAMTVAPPCRVHTNPEVVFERVVHEAKHLRRSSTRLELGTVDSSRGPGRGRPHARRGVPDGTRPNPVRTSGVGTPVETP